MPRPILADCLTASWIAPLRRRLGRCLLAAVLAASTLAGPAAADPSDSPALAAARSDASTAAATAERMHSHAAAIAELATRSHATPIERLEAAERASIADALAIAATDRVRLLATGVEPGNVRRARGSRFVWLPAGLSEVPSTETPQPVELTSLPVSTTPVSTTPVSTTPDLIPWLGGLLQAEAAAADAAWWAAETQRVQSHRDAVLSLYNDRHATAQERDAVLAADARLAEAIAAGESHRAGLGELAGSIPSMPLPDITADLDTLINRLAADPSAPAAAELLAAGQTLSQTAASVRIAEAEAATARDRLARIERLDPSARHPRELESATLDRDQADAAVAAADHEHRLAGSSAAWLLAWADAPVALPDLPSELVTAGPSLASTQSADLNADLDADLTETLLLHSRIGSRHAGSSFANAAQPQAFAYDLGTPYDPFGYGPGDDLRNPPAAAYPGINLGSSPLPGSTRLFQPGATYSSGYAFGQTRYDLPRELRYPRADSYGGPWSFPGSPTDRLRFRQRTPLRWGPAY